MQTNRTTITLNDHGFTLTSVDGSETIQWVHIAEVVAYRRDPVGVDLLCLAFRVGPAGRYIEINEEMPGYEELLENLYEAFPQISRTWWQDVTEGLGSNRVTIYGLPAGESDESSPAERYLQQIHRRKPLTRSDWAKIGWAGAGVWGAAGVQTFLAWFFAGWNTLLVMSALPLTLTVIAARCVQRPRRIYLILLSFYLAEAIWALILGRFPASLVGKLFEGKFSWLLLLGAEILLAICVMLLPSKRTTETKLR